ncbi:hypothetical protein [Acetobacter nitrogenifigens]|nr:hypothetical protein [Acetobacter nitrogenifigens]
MALLAKNRRYLPENLPQTFSRSACLRRHGKKHNAGALAER